jgi:hypothetical protein
MKTILISLALALSAVGCTHPATMAAPPGFGRVDGSYDFRAVNPQGVVVAARSENNEPKSDLGFWAAAVDLKLARKGYARTAATDVKSSDGLPGRLMKYDTGSGNVYWIAVFATDSKVLVSEATGWKTDMEASSKQIEASLLSARVN